MKFKKPFHRLLSFPGMLTRQTNITNFDTSFYYFYKIPSNHTRRPSLIQTVWDQEGVWICKILGLELFFSEYHYIFMYLLYRTLCTYL